MTEKTNDSAAPSRDSKAHELTSQLWAMANSLRGKMDASEFRDYILGFIFYRYLSAKQERFIKSSYLLDIHEGETVNDAYTRDVQEEGIDEWHQALSEELGYAIDPEDTWTTLVGKVKDQQVRPEDFGNIFDHFKKNAELNVHASRDFRGVFDDLNLMNSSLGNSTAARTKALADLVERIDEVNFLDESGKDILGDVYEYLIAQFAGNSGKKAGEFYTPHEVSRVLAKLVTYVPDDSSETERAAVTEPGKDFEVYDPTCGSGSLLLTVQRELANANGGTLPEDKHVHFFGQELNSTTYNLARMNLMMHDVPYQWMDLRNADTLEQDWPTVRILTESIIRIPLMRSLQTRLTPSIGTTPIQSSRIRASVLTESLLRNPRPIMHSSSTAFTTLRPLVAWQSCSPMECFSVVQQRAPSASPSSTRTILTP